MVSVSRIILRKSFPLSYCYTISAVNVTIKKYHVHCPALALTKLRFIFSFVAKILSESNLVIKSQLCFKNTEIPFLFSLIGWVLVYLCLSNTPLQTCSEMYYDSLSGSYFIFTQTLTPLDMVKMRTTGIPSHALQKILPLIWRVWISALLDQVVKKNWLFYFSI